MACVYSSVSGLHASLLYLLHSFLKNCVPIRRGMTERLYSHGVQHVSTALHYVTFNFPTYPKTFETGHGKLTWHVTGWDATYLPTHLHHPPPSPTPYSLPPVAALYFTLCAYTRRTHTLPAHFFPFCICPLLPARHAAFCDFVAYFVCCQWWVVLACMDEPRTGAF